MLWEWVREERTRRGWSQSELARRAGLSSRLISAGEGGHKPKPSGQTLQKLAAVFGLTVDALLVATGDVAPTRSPTLAEVRRLSVGGSPAALRFLAVLEQDYYTVSDQAWHTLTQVLQAMITHDRAQQIEEGQRRAGVHADGDHPSEAMKAIQSG